MKFSYARLLLSEIFVRAIAVYAPTVPTKPAKEREKKREDSRWKQGYSITEDETLVS